jgi:hypothetical protein
MIGVFRKNVDLIAVALLLLLGQLYSRLPHSVFFECIPQKTITIRKHFSSPMLVLPHVQFTRD